MFGEVAEGAVGGEVVERGEGDVVFVGEGGEGEVRVEDAGGGVVLAGMGQSVWGLVRLCGREGGRERGDCCEMMARGAKGWREGAYFAFILTSSASYFF